MRAPSPVHLLILLALSATHSGCPTTGGNEADPGDCPALCHELLDNLIAVWDDLGLEGDAETVVGAHRDSCNAIPTVIEDCRLCADRIDENVPFVDEWEILPDLLAYYHFNDIEELSQERIDEVEAACEDHGLAF